MTYSKMLRERFPDITLHAEDLLLLETFQIKYLPDRVAEKEFSTLLREFPVVRRYLESRYPPIVSFIATLPEKQEGASRQQIREQCQEALWEIADLILYNKHPELYDQSTGIQWDLNEITSITPLDGKTVADVGAGSGRIAFMVAPVASTVYAIEPVAGFRSLMKGKAVRNSIRNLFVMDGTLDSIPLPDNSLDVLITSNAIGWNLEAELLEIERVVKPGGSVIHLLSSDPQQENPIHKNLISVPWNYRYNKDSSETRIKIRYHKRLTLQNNTGTK